MGVHSNQASSIAVEIQIMKILVIGNRIPWPIKDGGAMASFQLLKGYAEAGVQVCFVTLNTKKHWLDETAMQEAFPFCETRAIAHDANLHPMKALQNVFSSRSYFLDRYRNAQALRVLEEQVIGVDWVQVEGLYSMPLAMELKRKFPEIKCAYRAHNVEYQIWERLLHSHLPWWKKLYLRIQVARLKREEVQAWNWADALLPISRDDQVHMREHAPQVDSCLLLPGVPVQVQRSLPLKLHSVCHLGSMEWMANQEGVAWFLREVWPLVLKGNQKAEFHLAGKGMDPNDPRFSGPGVINHGEVADSSEFLQSHGILVVPLQAGSGIRMKTLEALALGVPVVSTPVGAQGLESTSGEGLEIAESPTQMASQLLEWMSNAPVAQAAAEKGAAAVQVKYNLETNVAQALAFLRQRN